jgi:hypothetical protein
MIKTFGKATIKTLPSTIEGEEPGVGPGLRGSGLFLALHLLPTRVSSRLGMTIRMTWLEGDSNNRSRRAYSSDKLGSFSLVEDVQ